jgi:hypothetical protein
MVNEEKEDEGRLEVKKKRGGSHSRGRRMRTRLQGVEQDGISPDVD